MSASVGGRGAEGPNAAAFDLIRRNFFLKIVASAWPFARSTRKPAFERVLSVARAQRAKSWELRAATSLARLWRDHGKRDAACDLLAPVYGWFTEGFETLDLKEAKTLLDALAS
jgi:predicted ATPase